MVQWLRLWAPSAEDTGSIPGQGTEIPHATQLTQKKRKMEGLWFSAVILCGSLVDYLGRKHAYTLKFFGVSRAWTPHLMHGSPSVPSRHWVPSPRPYASRKGPFKLSCGRGPCRPESDCPDSRPAVSSR